MIESRFTFEIGVAVHSLCSYRQPCTQQQCDAYSEWRGDWWVLWSEDIRLSRGAPIGLRGRTAVHKTLVSASRVARKTVCLSSRNIGLDCPCWLQTRIGSRASQSFRSRRYGARQCPMGPKCCTPFSPPSSWLHTSRRCHQSM